MGDQDTPASAEEKVSCIPHFDALWFCYCEPHQMQLEVSLLSLRMSDFELLYQAPTQFDSGPVFLQLLPTSCDTTISGAMWMIVSSTGAPSGIV